MTVIIFRLIISLDGLSDLPSVPKIETERTIRSASISLLMSESLKVI
ncbi:MAG: hypothetical protein WC170_07985 [Bacteroidales bacterium]